MEEGIYGCISTQVYVHICQRTMCIIVLDHTYTYRYVPTYTHLADADLQEVLRRSLLESRPANAAGGRSAGGT